MRRLILLLAVLVLCTDLSAHAEERQLIETSLFSVKIPAGLNPDQDEFMLADYSFLLHILRPITIQGENDAYSLLITLYDFPSKERHKIDSQSNRNQALYDLMCEYSGLTGAMTRRSVRPEGDFRDFYVGSHSRKGYHMTTYYNEKRGEGYLFELHAKDGALSAAEAESILLNIAASLREVGEVYPEYTGKTLIVTHVGINVRSGPDANSSVLMVAKQGDTFPFLGENGIWHMIDVNGKIGYVSKALTQVQ